MGATTFADQGSRKSDNEVARAMRAQLLPEDANFCGHGRKSRTPDFPQKDGFCAFRAKTQLFPLPCAYAAHILAFFGQYVKHHGNSRYFWRILSIFAQNLAVLGSLVILWLRTLQRLLVRYGGSMSALMLPDPGSGVPGPRIWPPRPGSGPDPAPERPKKGTFGDKSDPFAAWG